MQSTAATLFSAYAQFAASMMLVRSMANELIPPSLKSYIHLAIGYLFTPLSNQITIIIDDQAGMNRNQVYESAEIYLSTKISPTTDRFKVNKTPKQKSINVSMAKDQEITDLFNQKIVVKWKFTFQEARFDQVHTPEKRYFELTFSNKYKDTILNDYLPFVMEKAKEIKANERVVKLYTRDCPYFDEDYSSGVPGGGGVWGSINLDHPATFDTLAMDKEMKKAIIDDLDRFLRRRDYYKKVGKAWKRGYLLYGPPGTGKSSLVAAMANYLKFDVYDLELTSLYSNSELRRILVSTTNRSIIVIEDIDCSVEMQDRQLGQDSNSKLTLSGLLNFIDGLWSSCGDERIIVFTTNYKEKIDPALLRPGRMDMHIHMSYCTSEGFKTLAFNYLGVEDVEDHSHFSKIESLIDEVQVTPAEIAEELMRSEDADLALEGVVNFLKRKREESEETNKVESLPGLPVQENGIMGLESFRASDVQKPKRLKTDQIIRALRNLRYKRPTRFGGARSGRVIRGGWA